MSISTSETQLKAELRVYKNITRFLIIVLELITLCSVFTNSDVYLS
ncbi:hypothetical protein CLV51_1011341 [Chitinophaga niastensis]|uniref:Uncharacterized protein n=1 Tax=Chitinophaga niastensis TaxID=536980 RepID=A0A2P8HUU3_CHINA|nr:hypothetical protein CLV51_1011341 [Chitinophaga niastensis]